MLWVGLPQNILISAKQFVCQRVVCIVGVSVHLSFTGTGLMHTLALSTPLQAEHRSSSISLHNQIHFSRVP